MQTISKCLIIAVGVVSLLSCAGTGQKVKDMSQDFVPVEEAPMILIEAKPEYPQSAIDLDITGTIWVKVLVDTLGNVREVRITRNVGENITFFIQSVIDAALKTKWKPALSGGRPIATWVTYRVDFSHKKK